MLQTTAALKEPRTCRESTAGALKAAHLGGLLPIYSYTYTRKPGPVHAKPHHSPFLLSDPAGKRCRFRKRTLIPCTPPERAPLLSVLGDTFCSNVPFSPFFISLSNADTPVRSNAVEKTKKKTRSRQERQRESGTPKPSGASRRLTASCFLRSSAMERQ